jgi:hypothetical protein
MLLVGMPRQMAEHIGLADESEFSPELCARDGAVEGCGYFGCGYCRSFAPLRMTILGAPVRVTIRSAAVRMTIRGGHATGPPCPLPVREGSVYQQSNVEDMGGPEHQICLSKGVIGKYVQPLELGSAIQAGAPGARAAGFAPLSLTPAFVVTRHPHLFKT